MNQEEIDKKVDEIIEKQKINGLSPETRRMLPFLKMAFEESIDRIDQILFGDDIKTALGYIIRDWNIVEYQRNDVIIHIMEMLEGDFKSMKDDEQ